MTVAQLIQELKGYPPTMKVAIGELVFTKTTRDVRVMKIVEVRANSDEVVIEGQ